MSKLPAILGVCCLINASAPQAGEAPVPPPGPSAGGGETAVRPRLRWADYAKRGVEWFRSTEARGVADNILSHQAPEGSWPKNTDTFGRRFTGDAKELKGTFDNGATVGECRFLARVGRASQEARYLAALDRALDLLLKAQYGNGGWPQSYPPGSGYARYITFNDGTMVNILNLMRDVAESPEFGMIEPARRAKAKAAFARGVECILRCQIRRGGTLTVWCAQHDEVTLEPRKARSYEHPSLSGAESAEIARFLMTLPSPRPEVIRAVDAACAWFETSRLTGIRQIKQGGDKVIVPDRDAPPLWARFYEIDFNRPIFSGRDGVIRYALADIEPERRNGYAWYGDWGTDLLERWRAWKATLPGGRNPPP